MAITITLGLQKGGVSKTTTTGILSYLLARDNYRVLAVDMDSQGNLTELLTDVPSNHFINQSVFEAIAFKSPEDYIFNVQENLDVLPANNFLSSFARWIYTKNLPNHPEKVSFEGLPHEQLKKTLDLVSDQYDFILIDTPPALSEQTSNALVASDYVIVLFESSKFCYSAIPNFMETIDYVVENVKDLKKLGILRTLNDKRRSDSKAYNEVIASDYPELVFETVITRKAKTGRIPLYGFEDNEELDEALTEFEEFYKEFHERLKMDHKDFYKEYHDRMKKLVEKLINADTGTEIIEKNNKFFVKNENIKVEITKDDAKELGYEIEEDEGEK